MTFKLLVALLALVASVHAATMQASFCEAARCAGADSYDGAYYRSVLANTHQQITARAIVINYNDATTAENAVAFVSDVNEWFRGSNLKLVFDTPQYVEVPAFAGLDGDSLTDAQIEQAWRKSKVYLNELVLESDSPGASNFVWESYTIRIFFAKAHPDNGHFATFPWVTDNAGVEGTLFINARENYGWSRRLTIAHEIGHCLGLLHTFETTCGCSNPFETTGSFSDGDLVGDTAAEGVTFYSNEVRASGTCSTSATDATDVTDIAVQWYNTTRCGALACTGANSHQYSAPESGASDLETYYDGWCMRRYVATTGDSFSNIMSYNVDWCPDQPFSARLTVGQIARVHCIYNEYYRGYSSPDVQPNNFRDTAASGDESSGLSTLTIALIAGGGALCLLLVCGVVVACVVLAGMRRRRHGNGGAAESSSSRRGARINPLTGRAAHSVRRGDSRYHRSQSNRANSFYRK